MTLTLYVLSGKELGRVERFEHNQILIGRAEGADLRLQSPGISREHARLIRKGPEVVQLVDLDSTSGTFLLDGATSDSSAERVRQVVLSDGAMFRLANVELRLRIEAGPVGLAEAEDMAAGAEPDAGLELEGEWSETTIAPSRSVPQAPKPTPGPSASKAKATKKPASELEKLRQQAASAERTQVGGKVLQYSRVDGEAGIAGGDFSERPGWQRVFIVVVALALFGALAYGSFQLTQGLREARSLPAEPLD